MPHVLNAADSAAGKTLHTHTHTHTHSHCGVWPPSLTVGSSHMAAGSVTCLADNQRTSKPQTARTELRESAPLFDVRLEEWERDTGTPTDQSALKSRRWAAPLPLNELCSKTHHAHTQVLFVKKAWSVNGRLYNEQSPDWQLFLN